MGAQSRPAAASSPWLLSPGSLAGWVTAWNVAWATALAAGRQGEADDDSLSLRLREAGRAGHVADRLRRAAASSLPDGDPRREAALTLARWIEGEESVWDAFADGQPLSGEDALTPAFLALGWWAWAHELGLRVVRGEGDGDAPSWEALRRGLLACCADVVRLERTVRAATRPARNPLGRIAAGLMEASGALQRGLQELERTLKASERVSASDHLEEAAVRTALWQRLVFVWSQSRAVQAQLVYLPTPEVPPVVYTVLEDVFPGFPLSQSVALTAVPSPLAHGYGPDVPFAGDMGVGGTVIGVSLENVENPLSWPLLGGALARRLAADVSFGGEGLRAGDSPSTNDPSSEHYEARGESDGMALAAFGPAYPLALTAWWAGGRPLMAIPADLWKRIGALLDMLDERGAGLPEARAWCEAMMQLHPPLEPRRAPWDGGSAAAGAFHAGVLNGDSLNGEEDDASSFEAWRRGVQRGWDIWAAGGRAPYSAADADVAKRLMEGLAEGRLISSLRVTEAESVRGAGREAGSSGWTSPRLGAAADGAAGDLYALLEQVRDVPAGSAQIIAAGWHYYIGLLADGNGPGGWNGGEYDGMFGETARRLESLDLLLMRSLEVAGVHRFYRRAVDEP